jgi:hypothetical protein
MVLYSTERDVVADGISVMGEVLLLLGLTGLTLIVVRATIFHDFRAWLLRVRPQDVGYLFTCPQCMGFWIGLLGGMVYVDLWAAPIYAGGVSLLAMLADWWVMSVRSME